MTVTIKVCPHHWKTGCWPPPPGGRPGAPPPQTDPKPVPTPAQPSQPGTQPYNALYLIDEHNVTNDTTQTVKRNGPTLQRRWVFHHRQVNLKTLNAGELPDVIQLHDQIANPKVNSSFKWEGFMFGQ